MTCAHERAFVEPLLYLPQDPALPSQVRFGSVNICVTCRAHRSEPRMDYPGGDQVVQKAVKAFSGTSWVMMLDTHRHPPYLFVLGTAGILIPNNYAGHRRVQAELPVAEPEPDIIEPEELF